MKHAFTAVDPRLDKGSNGRGFKLKIKVHNGAGKQNTVSDGDTITLDFSKDVWGFVVRAWVRHVTGLSV